MNEERLRPIRRSIATDLAPAVKSERDALTAEDHVTKKKRKKRLSHGGKFVDEKDRAIVELVIAYGWLSRFQLSDLLGISAVTIHRRAQRLAAVGFINDLSRGAAGEVLYVPTRAGMRTVGMAKGFKVTTPTYQTMNHNDGLVAAALRFKESPRRHGLVVTEREIEAAAMTGVLSPRVQRIAPWAQQQFQGRLKTWLPVADAISGTGKGFKRPDMLLIIQGQPPTVVELEITQKSAIRHYVRILEAYDGAQKAGHIANPIIYVTVEVAGNHNDIKKALETAFTRANLSHRMSLKFLVFNVGIEYWNPRSAKNGWFPKRRRPS